MNEDIRSKIEHAGITYLPPMDRKSELIGIMNPLQKRSNYLNEGYHQNVQSVVNQLNNQMMQSHTMLNQEITGPSGQRIMRGLNTPYNTLGQSQIEKFQDLSNQNKFFTYDIETLGDAMNKTDFSVSEIAIMGMHRTGDHFKENNDRFVRIIQPNNTVVNQMNDVITRLEANPYAFNTMTDAQKRTLVDITRYSTLTEGDIKGFNPVFSKTGQLHDFTHNTLANRMFEREVMVNQRVINNMDSILRHAKQGLHDIQHSKYAITANDAITDYNAFLNTNKQSYFVSYNGDSFDVPTLAAWGGLEGNKKVVRPEKHLDYYRVIQTVYPNPIELHKKMGRNTSVNPIHTGVSKLPEFMKTLGGESANAHNSLVDIGEHGLGGLVGESMPLINQQLKNSHIPLTPGVNLKQPQFTWTNQPLKIGDTIFSAGGARARRDGEFSFGATMNKEGKLVPVNDSFNTTIINSNTLYTVANQFEVGEGTDRKIGLSLYDRERDRYVNVIRQGEEAFEELTGFVQNRFYNVQGMEPSQLKALEEKRLRDSARRRYERTYSLDSAGTGRSGGFELAHRLYSNASIAEQRLGGKDKYIQGEDYRQLKTNRITHGQLEEALKGKFDSLWDPVNRRYVHNQSEQDLFFRMSNRLISEKEAFLPALEYIRENISNPQDRDIAWRDYRLQVEGNFSPAKETIDLMDFESRMVPFTDIQTGAERNLNVTSLQATMDSIKRQVYTSDISQNETLTPRLRQDRYRERLNLLIKNLRSSDVIDQHLARELTDINVNAATVNNAIIETANILASTEMNYTKQIEQTSLRANQAILNLTPETNQLMFEASVKKLREIKSTNYIQNNIPGSQVNFGPSTEEALRKMDQSQLSGLSPNNRAAIESVMNTIEQNNETRGLNYALSFDGDRNTARISVYNSNSSVSVVEQLMKHNADHPQALTIDIPLISESGIHTIGDRRLNARTKGIYNQSTGQVEYISTAQEMANNYNRSMGRMLSLAAQGDFDAANQAAKRTLNESVKNLSGIQRNLNFNDTADFNQTQADFFKQSAVDVDSAMIQDLYYNRDSSRVFREVGPNESAEKRYRLTDADFKPDAFEGGKLKANVSIDDLWNRPAFEVGLNAPNWFEEKDLNLFFGSGKAEMATRNIFSQVDIRDYIPYGHYTFQGRDNTVQYQNTYAIEDARRRNLERAVEGTNAYLNFNDVVTTDAQRAYEQSLTGYEGQNRGMNVKVAMMNDAEMMNRLRNLAQSNEGREILKREGMLNPDGTLNELRTPRIYENQGLVARELQNEIRVREEQVLAQSDNYRLFNQFEDGSSLTPGQQIGYQTINGVETPMYYNQSVPGELIVRNNRLAATWEETPFKFMLEGEKITDVTVSQELISAITGDDSVTFVANANMKKHKDYGMYLSGKAKILGDHLQRTQMRLDDATAAAPLTDRASQKALERITIENEKQSIINQLGKVNLAWDEEARVLLQRGNADIAQEAFDEVFDELGIIDRTKYQHDLFILEARPAKVRNYSRMTDELGRETLTVLHDANGNPVNVIKKRQGVGIDGEDQFVQKGVRWGHREMGVLKNQGLDYTQDSVYQMMIRQADQKGTLARVSAMNAVLEGVANPSSPSLGLAGTLTTDMYDLLRSPPEIDADWNTYRKTLFDQSYIQEITGGQNQHGYWLELPSIEQASGNDLRVTINQTGGKDGRAQTNRIFIPFTNLEGANGQVHLDELQKLNRNIIRRAEAVVNADPTDQVRLMGDLQDATDKYYRQVAKDLTSSKGFTGERVFKADLASSGTGLFKLLDPDISQDLDGEFTFISRDDAKRMGVYDDLLNIEQQRAAGQTVDDLMTMGTRYPTFHDHAMQLSKLRMSDDVRSGEFLTTSWQSALRGADSDGDYDNIVVLRNEDGTLDTQAQKEWRTAYERQQSQRDQAYQGLLDKESSRHTREFGSKYVLDGEDAFRAYTPNAQDEVAAKIGKRVIGSASNLNLYMRQMADEFLPGDSPERQAIKDFGQLVEQKPISSKHGVTIDKGTVPAIDMINSIYNGDWNTLRNIRTDYYADDFDEDLMERAIRGMEQVRDRMDQGLRSPGLKFGTSYGLSDDIGLAHISDIIHARTPENQYVQSNHMQRMMQRLLGIDSSKQYVDLEGNVHHQVDPYESMHMEGRKPRVDSFANAAGEYAHDLTGGIFESTEDKVRNMFETISNNRNMKFGLIAGGLALGALGGYNILKYDEPLTPPIDNNEHYTVNQAPQQSALDMNSMNQPQMQNADIQIQASGQNIDQSQFSHMVNEGMQSSNMQAGPSRVSINHTDNTNQLNRIWYRDKVEEYV